MNRLSDFDLFCLGVFACMACAFLPAIAREARWQLNQHQQPGAYEGAPQAELTAEDAAYLESME
jgi:hypothetical protein